MNKEVRIATGWNMHPPVSAIQAHPQFSVCVMADFVDDVAVRTSASFGLRGLFSDRDSVTPLSELRHRRNSPLRLGSSVLPTILKESTYGKSEEHNYWRYPCWGCDHRHYDLDHSFLL
jgi:hypothetical protein